MKQIVWTGAALVLLGGCGLFGADNDLRPVEVSLASAVTVAQAGAIALEAMEGSGSVRCASVTAACTEYPCDGAVEIRYGAGCPLPLGGEAIGTTTVTGRWSTESEARLDFQFTDVRVDGRSSVVASATTIDVSREGGVTTVELTGANAQTRGAVALAAASSWTIEIDDAWTPEDPSDDTYLIDGASSAAGGASGGAVTADRVLVSPECRLNPVAGEASITAAGVTNIRTDRLTFHATCDGTAELETTLGDPGLVPLDFLVDVD